MSSQRPPQVLADEIVASGEHGGRPLVVAGPPTALDESASGVDDAVVVGDGGHVSTFFRGFTTTELSGPPAAWDLTFGREVWGPRDGWVSFTTDQTFLGGTDDPAAVLAELRSLAETFEVLESEAGTHGRE